MHVLLLSGEGFNIASVLCPIPFHVNEIKYVSINFKTVEMNGNTNKIPQTGSPPHPPVVVPAPFSVNLSFMMLFQTGGRLCHQQSLLSEGFKARMLIASFTPLSNNLCSMDNIFVFSNMMVWLGLSVCMLQANYVIRHFVKCLKNSVIS